MQKKNVPNKDNGKYNEKLIYIAIASITSPKETYIYYKELIDFISKKVGKPIIIVQKKTYEEVNMLLENSEVDFAFICSGAFVEEYKTGKIKILAVPQIDGKITYQAYIITQKNSKINSFNDFRNKSFAFTDPLSNTGKLYPLIRLLQIKSSEQIFFSKTVYTYGHDISIQMVNRGIIDGASVHSLIFHYLSINHPERVENIKIVEKSEEYGMPPVVTPITLNKQTFNTYQAIFTNLQNDSIGKSILKKLHIEKFVTAKDTIYKSVFQLKKNIDNATQK